MPIFDKRDIFHPTYRSKAMIVGADSYAYEEALAVLKEGGNAVDAAVTMAFCLAVTNPQAGNLGGGGFMMIYLKDLDQVISIDYREKAPKLATQTMFLDEVGNVDSKKSLETYFAAGVPGTVKGLGTALEKFGTISLKRAVFPAIRLAESGIIVNERLHRVLLENQSLMMRSAAKNIFFKSDSEPLSVGDLLVQSDLAWTLKQISKQGSDAFYTGEIAQIIASEMTANGGLISLEDLRDYTAILRSPLRGYYKGYDIYTMSPPSSGGVHLIQMLNLLSHFPIKTWGYHSSRTIHVMIEVMKRAFADRGKHLGDMDFKPVPVDALISKRYAKQLLKTISLNKATSSKKILPGNPYIKESRNTNHFTIVDQLGNVVSNTYSLNQNFGSKLYNSESLFSVILNSFITLYH